MRYLRGMPDTISIWPFEAAPSRFRAVCSRGHWDRVAYVPDGHQGEAYTYLPQEAMEDDAEWIDWPGGGQVICWRVS